MDKYFDVLEDEENDALIRKWFFFVVVQSLYLFSLKNIFLRFFFVFVCMLFIVFINDFCYGLKLTKKNAHLLSARSE